MFDPDFSNVRLDFNLLTNKLMSDILVVLETEALTFQHTPHWPDSELTLNGHRNMILVPAQLRVSFTSAIVHSITVFPN